MHEIRKRAENEGLAVTRSCNAIVAETRRRLAEWNETMALLREKARRPGFDRSQLRATAAEISVLAFSQRIALDAAAEEAGPQVAQHSIVRDARDSLDQLISTLQDVGA